MKRGDTGSALVLVLVAISILLPMTLILSAMVVRWQRHAVDFRDTLGAELLARAGFEAAWARAQTSSLGVNETARFDVREPGWPAAEVRLTREADAVISAEGNILEPAQAASADLKARGVDPEGRIVYRYRKIDVYRVEVDVQTRPNMMTVRLIGVLVRRPDDTVVSAGVGLERGFFSPPKTRALPRSGSRPQSISSRSPSEPSLGRSRSYQAPTSNATDH